MQGYKLVIVFFDQLSSLRTPAQVAEKILLGRDLEFAEQLSRGIC